jgi:putative glutamine amidotransferase
MNSATHRPPLVLLPMCSRDLEGHPFQVVGEKYLNALQLAGCQPLLLPSMSGQDMHAMLDIADGVLLTGSPSNIEPSRFDQANENPGLPLDPRRDAHTLALARVAIDRGLPLLAICRGLQELNVAYGGTLHQTVHALPNRRDHRAAERLGVEQAYGPAHSVEVRSGGLLEQLVSCRYLVVNSLHGQAIDELGKPLRVEAVSEDGVIEACSVDGAKTFALGVQWHPEWRAENNEISMHILNAFGAACRTYRDGLMADRPR